MSMVRKKGSVGSRMPFSAVPCNVCKKMPKFAIQSMMD